MDQIILKSRLLFNKVIGGITQKNIDNFNDIKPGDLQGLCGISQSCIYYAMLESGIDISKFKLLQLSPFFSKYSHACVVYYVGDDIYILDLTFSQFLTDWDIIGIFFVKNGYIKLTNATIKWLYKKLNGRSTDTLPSNPRSGYDRRESGEVERSDTLPGLAPELPRTQRYINIFKDPPQNMLCEVDHDRHEIFL